MLGLQDITNWTTRLSVIGSKYMSNIQIITEPANIPKKATCASYEKCNMKVMSSVYARSNV